MPAASVRSTLGPAFGGASCDKTTPNVASTDNFALQQGQVMLHVVLFFCPMPVLYSSRHTKIGARRSRPYGASCGEERSGFGGIFSPGEAGRRDTHRPHHLGIGAWRSLRRRCK